jgi:hypothetical protein
MSETELQILRETQAMLDERLRLVDEQMAHFAGLSPSERAIEAENWVRRQIAQALAPLTLRLEKLEIKPAPAPAPIATAFNPSKLIADIGQVIRDELKPLEQRIEKLEQRGWRGDYQRAMAYPMQSEVRHKHATWIAIRDIAPGEVPGEGATGWQLKDRAQTPPRQPTHPRTVP